tara:strand:+ start:611 stop:1462 length:852 start_codon:yes stop_codon:yes gene_type:complete
MIYRTESIFVTIDKIVRDLDLGSNEIPENDMIEWCMDALEHIGAYTQLEKKGCNLAVIDHVAQLPCDLHEVRSFDRAVEVKLKNDYRFYAGTYQQALADAEQDWSEMPPYEKYKDLIAGITRPSNYHDRDRPYNGLTRNEDMFSLNDNFSDSDYVIKHNSIMTSFKEGVIYLRYLAFPVDEHGYPEVPANVSYRDALYWKVCYHLAMRNSPLLKNNLMKDVRYCQQQWNFYCTQARAEANMQDMEGMIRISNNMNRLFKTQDDYANGFRTLGKPQYFVADGRN